MTNNVSFPIAIHNHYQPFLVNNISLQVPNVVIGLPIEVISGAVWLTEGDKIIGESFDSSVISPSTSNPSVMYSQVTKTIILYNVDIITFDTITMFYDGSVSDSKIFIPITPIPGVGFTGDQYTLTFDGYRRTSDEPIQYNYILNKVNK
jgi:hypothetical protein